MKFVQKSFVWFDKNKTLHVVKSIVAAKKAIQSKVKRWFGRSGVSQMNTFEQVHGYRGRISYAKKFEHDLGAGILTKYPQVNNFEQDISH